MSTRQQVAAVTGGGGGIGAAVAEELGRRGWFVVTVDPMVTLDGSERVSEPIETTAERIVNGGGAARASTASVTDATALRDLFEEIVDEHGGLDAVVNVAGITRQSGFAHGTETDFAALLDVHLGGYLNILEAAMPLMTDARHGRILGVTSGSGWRAADAGGYSCAKRAVASLTWQLGKVAPEGVTVNAMSPIAATRMVAAAIERARQAPRPGGGGGGLSLSAMAGPEHLGPIGAHLVSDEFGWCSGRVLFTAGSEIAVIDEPRPIEVLRTHDAVSLARVLEAALPRAFAKAEAAQATDGGSNPRFGPIFAEPGTHGDNTAVKACVVVTDAGAPLGSAVIAALESRSVTCHRLEAQPGFDAAARGLRSVVEARGEVDAIVVATSGTEVRAPAIEAWQRVLAEHRGIVASIHGDAAWARAAADYATAGAKAIALVTLVDANSAGGRSRAQAAAQLSRVSKQTTEGRVAAFALSIESSGESAGPSAGELVSQLLVNPEAAALSGAELVVGAGWIGLRSHPRPIGSVVYGGPEVPPWLDDTLRQVVGAPSTEM
ncbi:MAG: SDR family NAD(P)-dependent oxidoreductase [Acidimicrobiales bacterium]